jgi:hypothetical protein
MEFKTTVAIPEPAFRFSYADGILVLGSCFAGEIGRRLEEHRFRVDINPFGTLYNPLSIACSLRRLMEPEPFKASDLFAHEGLYHSFAHHGSFSASSEAGALEGMNARLEQASANLRRATRIVVTFGTACVYRLKDGAQPVSNCHKLPGRLFERELMPPDALAEEWQRLLVSLLEWNPSLRLLFTVSPVRHWKDGAHAGQLSKASLLWAVDRLQSLFPGQAAYFPAYEIVMDELRDYRFYADDMLHPSPLAVEYVWERFCGALLSAGAQSLMGEWADVRKALRHQPFHPGSEAHRRFVEQTLLKAERLSEKFPFFDISKEIEGLKLKKG